MKNLQKHILIVEDEAVIALQEAAQLKNAGYAVMHVFTGEEAVETMSSDSGRVDLILMDINLGRGMDGTEAAQTILGRFSVPILFLSSHDEPDVVLKTEQIAGYGYVVKSSEFAVLDASIKMAFKLFETKTQLQARNAELEQLNNQLRSTVGNLQRTNMQLAVAEDKFSKTFHLNPLTMNINTLDDGTYLDINEGFTRFMGYSREEVIGQSSLPGGLSVWLREADRLDLASDLREHGVVENFETELRLKCGRIAPVSISGRLIELDGVTCVLSVTREIAGRPTVSGGD